MPRKTPFSGKQKKLQLQQRRERRQQRDNNGDDDDDDDNENSNSNNTSSDNDDDKVQRQQIDPEGDSGAEGTAATLQKKTGHAAWLQPQSLPSGNPQQPPSWLQAAFSNARLQAGRQTPNNPGRPGRGGLGNLKLKSVFDREDPEEIERRKRLAHDPINPLPQTALEVSMEDLYGPGAIMPIPRRPAWSYDTSKEDLDAAEQEMFESWLKGIYETHEREKLSYFEHNLEVWRQLWRVVEVSDVVLIVADVRHPVLHFPPALYEWVVKEMKRHLILVLNKADLVAADTLYAWTKYFEEKYPDLRVCKFSCYSRDPNMLPTDTTTTFLRSRVRKQRKRYHRAMGAKTLLEACRDLNIQKPNLTVNWDALVNSYFDDDEDDTEQVYLNMGGDDDDNDQEEGDDSDESGDDSDVLAGVARLELDEHSYAPKAGMLTISIIGHPNVGKSSLINSLVGKKVVSASRTPGHTKHFQTIHLAPELRLCDCPGLVFPSLVPKPLQILSGLFPIAHVQEPYTSVMYLAERLRIADVLQIRHPKQHEDDRIALQAQRDEMDRERHRKGLKPKKHEEPKGNSGRFRRKRSEEEKYPWSAWDICEAFAIQRGFLTAKAGRPDVYRAANAILRLVADGRILLSFKPPGYFSNRYLYIRRDELAAEEQKEKNGSQADDVHDENDNEDDCQDVDKDEVVSRKHGSKKDGSKSSHQFSSRFGILTDEDI